jgi:hypothetical protein
MASAAPLAEMRDAFGRITAALDAVDTVSAPVGTSLRVIEAHVADLRLARDAAKAAMLASRSAGERGAVMHAWLMGEMQVWGEVYNNDLNDGENTPGMIRKYMITSGMYALMAQVTQHKPIPDELDLAVKLRDALVRSIERDVAERAAKSAAALLAQ